MSRCLRLPQGALSQQTFRSLPIINRSLQSGKVQRKRTGGQDIRGLYYITILDYIIYNNEDNRQGVGGYREEKDNRIIEKRKGEER